MRLTDDISHDLVHNSTSAIICSLDTQSYSLRGGTGETNRNTATYWRYCSPYLFARVSGLHRDKVCVLNARVFPLSHAYIHTGKHLYQGCWITQGSGSTLDIDPLTKHKH